MRKILMAILIFSSTPAFAGICDHGREIVKCYHPTAQYARCEETPDNKATVYFQGVTGKPYQMDMILHQRNEFFRLELVKDTAILPPNRSCPLDGWQPMR